MLLATLCLSQRVHNDIAHATRKSTVLQTQRTSIPLRRSAQKNNERRVRSHVNACALSVADIAKTAECRAPRKS
jgi:hypothetical protein